MKDKKLFDDSNVVVEIIQLTTSLRARVYKASSSYLVTARNNK